MEFFHGQEKQFFLILNIFFVTILLTSKQVVSAAEEGKSADESALSERYTALKNAIMEQDSVEFYKQINDCDIYSILAAWEHGRKFDLTEPVPSKRGETKDSLVKFIGQKGGDLKGQMLANLRSKLAGNILEKPQGEADCITIRPAQRSVVVAIDKSGKKYRPMLKARRKLSASVWSTLKTALLTGGDELTHYLEENESKVFSAVQWILLNDPKFEKYKTRRPSLKAFLCRYVKDENEYYASQGKNVDEIVAAIKTARINKRLFRIPFEESPEYASRQPFNMMNRQLRHSESFNDASLPIEEVVKSSPPPFSMPFGDEGEFHRASLVFCALLKKCLFPQKDRFFYDAPPEQFCKVVACWRYGFKNDPDLLKYAMWDASKTIADTMIDFAVSQGIDVDVIHPGKEKSLRAVLNEKLGKYPLVVG